PASQRVGRGNREEEREEGGRAARPDRKPDRAQRFRPREHLGQPQRTRVHERRAEEERHEQHQDAEGGDEERAKEPVAHGRPSARSPDSASPNGSYPWDARIDLPSSPVRNSRKAEARSGRDDISSTLPVINVRWSRESMGTIASKLGNKCTVTSHTMAASSPPSTIWVPSSLTLIARVVVFRWMAVVVGSGSAA